MRILSAFILLAFASGAWAAKPLSRAHGHLDKKDQCNKCHVAFGGVPAANCRSCHRQIDQRISQGRGFHGRAVGGTPCNSCHREHLGRGHDLVGLDKRSFKHDATGWKLTGSHVGVTCRKCHTAKRPGTNRDSYLGASTNCSACHGEYHGRAAKSDLSQCERCHNTIEWRQINANLRFDHNRETRFPRTGEHQKVTCDKCHLGKRNFGPIQVQGCVTCHQDQHPPGVFGKRICEECHVTKGFTQNSIFEHASTGWPLRGKHKSQRCLECHKWKQWKPRTRDCVGCHKDEHRGQFKGTPCSRCHQESSFRKTKFNHDSMSRFPLRGKHKRVDCAKCHKNGKYKPIETECETCHTDQNPHGNTFEGRPCKNCHSPVDWRKTRFDHGITGFPLEGRHDDQPCFRCHPNGTETEDDTQRECGFCHSNVHGTQFDGRSQGKSEGGGDRRSGAENSPTDNKATPADISKRSNDPGRQSDEAKCERCHQGADQWVIPFFDHKLSRFELTGKHTEVRCDGCHKDGHFKPIDTACGNCHQNFHEGQFSKACTECHTTETWSQANFDHDKQSEYALRGAHRTLDCEKCHVRNDYKGVPQSCEGCHLDVHLGTKGPECARCHTETDWSGNQSQDHEFGTFKLGGVHDLLPCEECHGADRSKALAGTGPECVNCHRDPHFGSLGPMCADCHTQEHFLPTTFLHHETGFRLSGAHRFVECRECHPGRVFGGLPNDCGFCHQDTFARTAGTDCDHTAECPGGITACHNCHTTQSFAPARPGTTCGTCESSR